MYDSRAAIALVNLAISQHDAIWRTLRADRDSVQTQKQIADWNAGRIDGWFPAGETTKLLQVLRPRSGWSEFDKAYQEANADAIAAGIGAFLLPKLEVVYTAHRLLVDEAGKAFERSSDKLPTTEAHYKAVLALVHVLRSYKPRGGSSLPAPPASTAHDGDRSQQTAKQPRRKRGRPSAVDGAEDSQIVVAWATRQYMTYSELAKALSIPNGKQYTEDFIRRVIDRHRKRVRRTKSH